MARSVESLFERYRSRGDAAALGKVFDRTAPELLRVAMHLARHPAEAEDLLQETFLTAIDRADTWDASRPLVPWLLGILKNHARAARRKRRPLTWDVAAEGESETAREPWLDVAWTDEIGRGVDALGEPYREVLVLLLRHERTPAEVASLLDRPPGTVRSQAHRGLERLRRTLSSDVRSPALAALPLGSGLAGIRDQVLGHAAEVGAVASATSGTLLLTGGLVMSKKTMAFAVLMTALLIGGGGLLILQEFDAAPGSVHQPPTRTSAGADRLPSGEPVLEGRGAPAASPEGMRSLPSPVDLAMIDRTRDVHGRVVGADGAAVAGARVQVVSHPWRDQGLLTDGFAEVVEGPRTRTAEDGSFSIRLQPGALVTLRIVAEGLAVFERPRVQAGERVDAVLQPPAWLAVTVLGPSGVGVGGTRLRLVQRGGRGREATGITSEDGTCRLTDLEPHGNVMLDAVPPRFGHPRWIETTTAGPGAGTEILIRLEEGRTVRGRVTARATGEPVADARVGMGWTLKPEVRTDAKGDYELPGWTARGTRDIHVLAPGYARGSAVVGTADVIDFALEAGVGIRGRVIDATKRGLASARVSIVAYEQKTPMRSRMSNGEGVTDAEGRFHLGGFTPGMPHTLIAAAPGHGRRLIDFDVGAGGGSVVDLGDVMLEPGLGIAGVVRDAGGELVPRVAVRLQGANPDRAARRDGTPAQTSYGVTLERATDDLGRFLFPDLSVGSYTLRVRPRGGIEVRREIRLTKDGHPALGIRLPAMREVVVHVTDAEGRSVSGVRVAARGPRRQRCAALSEGNGEARLLLPEARVEDFRITVAGRLETGLLAPPPAMLQGDQDEITFVLAGASRVAGHLRTTDGRPIPQVCLVALRRGDHVAFSLRTDQSGAFEFRLPRGGPVDLVFDGDVQPNFPSTAWAAYAGRKDGVTIGTTDVVVTASREEADRYLDVRVLDPDGHPIAGAMVQARREGGMFENAETDEAGECRFEGLTGEAHAVSAYIPPSNRSPWVLAPQHVDVVPAGQRVEIRFRYARTVRGTARSPVPGALRRRVVRIERADGSVLTTGFLDGRGRFVVSVPIDEPGKLRIVAEAQRADGTKLEGRIDLPPPEAVDVVIELRKR